MSIPARNQFVKAVQYACAVAAYAFLAYKLARFDGYADLAAYFRSVSLRQWLWLPAMLVLLAVNIGIEAAKWRFVVSEVGRISFAEAVRSVLAGWVAAFVTPNRIGEVPGRALVAFRRNDDRLKSAVLGWLGAFTSTLVTVVCGLPACICLLRQQTIFNRPSIYLICCVLALGVLFLLTFFLPRIAAWLCQRRKWPERAQELLFAVGQLRSGYVWRTCGFSLLRYAVFCTQFWIMLRFFGIGLQPLEALAGIPAYYLFVTLTPSIGLSEPVVRGSWAIVALQLFSGNTAGIAFAAVSVWAINQVLPMLAGTLLRKG